LGMYATPPSGVDRSKTIVCRAKYMKKNEDCKQPSLVGYMGL